VIREVTFATEGKTVVLSGNVLLGMHRMALASIAKAQIELVHKVMGEAFGARAPFKVDLPPLGGYPVANRFSVTITRIHAGQGLDKVNLYTGMKHYEDAVAQHIYGGIIGRDDGRATFKCDFDQRRSTDGFVGCTIHIEDMDRGEPVIVYQVAPPRAGQAARERPPAPPKATPAEAPPKPVRPAQAPLVFRHAWLALPWLEDPASDRYEHLVEAGALSKLLDTPKAIRVKHPSSGVVHVLYRHDHSDAELGGRCWLYSDIQPAPQRT
jgi:hypothetical protein